MSSGCCHPKNLFPSLQRVQPTAGFAPLRGTKNPRSRFIHFNSASQSFVSYAVRLSDLPAASTTFCKFFFAAVALSNTFILPVLPESSTGSFYFFSACFRPRQNCLAKNRAHTIAGVGERASVFSKKFSFFCEDFNYATGSCFPTLYDFQPPARAEARHRVWRAKGSQDPAQGTSQEGEETGDAVAGVKALWVLNTCH
jgi:hypothetical protein